MPAVITHCMDGTYDEAVYVDGVLCLNDSTMYIRDVFQAMDIKKTGDTVTLAKWSTDLVVRKWPKSLDALRKKYKEGFNG